MNYDITENFGYSDIGGDWGKCNCSRMSQYLTIFSMECFWGQKTVTVGDCHCNRSSPGAITTQFCELFQVTRTAATGQ